MSNTVTMGWEILDRMERAVAKVRERLLRATSALNAAGIPYAVVGGNAVASWVATIDEGAVRNTPNIDLLVCRTDLLAIDSSLKVAGFRQLRKLEFLAYGDESEAGERSRIRLIFANELVQKQNLLPAPTIQTKIDSTGLHVILIESLLQMKLVAFRNVDAMHIRDMIDVGLVDQGGLAKLPRVLGERLQHILDTPGG